MGSRTSSRIITTWPRIETCSSARSRTRYSANKVEDPDVSGRFSVRYHAELPPDTHYPTAMLVRVVVKYLYPPSDPHSLVGIISTAYLLHKPSR